MLSKRQKSARKAARTRAANRAMFKRWREVDEPAGRRIELIMNMILPAMDTIKLRWNPLGGINRKLKHNSE